METSTTSPFTAADGTTHGIAVSRDISELKRAADELRESEARYRLVVEAQDDMMTESDPSGQIVFTTRNLGTNLGFTPEEMVALLPYARVNEDDVEQLGKEYHDALTTNTPVRLEPYRALTRNGDWRWFRSVGIAYQHASGERRFLNVTRDVTERVEAARRRSEQEARSHQAKRLESLGMMAGGMAHDFNNFLTPIMADTSLTLADLPEDSPHRHRLERIQRTARRAAELTRIGSMSRVFATRLSKDVMTSPRGCRVAWLILGFLSVCGARVDRSSICAATLRSAIARHAGQG